MSATRCCHRSSSPTMCCTSPIGRRCSPSAREESSSVSESLALAFPTDDPPRMAEHSSPSTRTFEPSRGSRLDLLQPFDYDSRTRVIFGQGAVRRLGELAREIGGRRVLLVTDKGLKRAGHERPAVESLEASGLAVAVFDDVTPNPTTEDVDRALEVARGENIDLLVGLGGGSSLDCAKGVNFLFTNGGRMEDYRGVGRAKH